MAGETNITIIGNLTSDPELRWTNNGVPVASFTVASTPRTFDRKSNEWRDDGALFLRCTVWREMAEHVAQSLTKGIRVIVTGVLRQKSYEVEGQRRTSYELTVDEVGPSLRYGTTQFTKAQRGGVQQGAGQPQTGFASGSSPQGGFGAQGDGWSNPGQPFGGNEEAPF